MTQRNWQIIGLTKANTVIVKINGMDPHDSMDPPSAYDVPYLTRKERGILRRGLTASGANRKSPVGKTIEI